MTQFLPENLLALFAPRPPLEFKFPVDELIVDRKRPPMDGLAAYVQHFEEASATPAKAKVETKEERKIRKRQDKQELMAYKIEQGIALWNANENSNATTDPYRTLFVGRISYETTESKLRREFEVYGKISKIVMVQDKEGKPRGYAFIEYSHKSEMSAAYKKADGIKIDGRRVVVDYERGRTQKNWLPRRLGGGKGDTRRTRESRAVIEAREVENGFSSSRDRGNEDRGRDRGRDDHGNRGYSGRSERRDREYDSRDRHREDRHSRPDRDPRNGDRSGSHRDRNDRSDRNRDYDRRDRHGDRGNRHER
ncbi:hypothetical protein QR680_013763 [Steinernema hermaphroditum]|uniref:U1 small nuclear ribonucleoprotein 70 kDa n=1 Tax=Steinernema hermaphroditum TaxID=289476 RepID=A0AA39I872_9BILA|nr:hypothetical protein QR680_013763 [Steinernema hermaphroditum]